MSAFDGIHFVFAHPLNRKQPVRTLFRVLWWKTNQLLFSFPAVVPLTDRIVCLCYPHLSYSGLIVYTKWPDYSEWNFLIQFLQKDSVFVDIGAHSGDYSLLAADKITSGSIFAFEPEPSVLPYLHKNVAINALEKIITIIPQAVSNEKGNVTFALGTHSETSHLAKGVDRNSGKKVTVAATTLDIFAKENKLSQIDVLKVDVEGAEGLVFEGAQQLLKQQKCNAILFELNPRNEVYGHTSREILRMLTFNGYNLYSFDSASKLSLVSKDVSLTETQNFIAFNQKTMKNSVVRKYLK